MSGTRVMNSKYIEWAKLRSQARFNLATSGVMHFPLRELGVTLDDIEISGPSWYGYEPLQIALAAKCGVGTDCVVAAIGTSMANYLAMAAMLAPGDEVLIEEPAYHPVLAIAQFIGCNVRRFRRSFESGFALEPAEIEKNITPQTRLIALTNLHNPSSAYASAETMRQIGEVAKKVGARVLVDEVYLEAILVQSPEKAALARSAIQLGPEFICTSSLTKAYGLSGLRCGWILAAPELAQRMWRLNDLFGNIPAHSAERLSVVALSRLDKISARARALLAANRALLDQFIASRKDLEFVAPEFGTIAFPRLRNGSVEKLCALLRENYETTVVPGAFFEMSQHFRIGIGGETATLKAGLERLGSALDELAAK